MTDRTDRLIDTLVREAQPVAHDVPVRLLRLAAMEIDNLPCWCSQFFLCLTEYFALCDSLADCYEFSS